MCLGQCLGLTEFKLGQHMGRGQSQVAQRPGDQNLGGGFWAGQPQEAWPLPFLCLQHLLSTYYVSATILGTESNKIPAFLELKFYRGNSQQSTDKYHQVVMRTMKEISNSGEEKGPEEVFE